MESSSTRPYYHLPSDAVWLITGCSSGIGQGLACHVAATSNRVVATARKLSALSPIPDTPNVLKVSLDVTSKASISNAIAAALDTFGRLDVVVNNAGYGLYGDAEGATDDQARRQVDTNFWGAADVTREAMRIMREENPKTGQIGGIVMQITSLGGFVGYPGGSFYHAAKFALEGFTEAVAKEIHPDWNIHFCIIEPGGVKTEYAGTSMVHIPQHPAYKDPSLPTNMLREYMKNPKAMDNFSTPSRVAEIMYEVVSRGQRIPFRLPLGADAWSMVKMKADKVAKELEEWKNWSLKTNNEKQLETLGFLMEDAQKH